MNAEDPKFQTWVDMVAPSPESAKTILVSIDLIAILQLLWQIYSLLAQLGCFAKAKVTRQTREALTWGLISSKPKLEKILQDLHKKTQKGK